MSTSPTSTHGDVLNNNNPVFPAEIFELIINDVATFDSPTASLRNCSLVCKDFIPICRPHLFRRVTFGPYRKLNRARQRLLQVIIDSPNIAKLIKEVVYRINQRKAGSGLVGGMAHLRRELNPSDEYSLILHEFLPNLETLHIKHAVPDHSEPCGGKRICQRIGRLVLEDLATFAKATVTNLKLTRLAIDIRSVFAIASIRTLETRDCQWLGPLDTLADPPLPSLLPSLLPLRSLSCTNDYLFPYSVLARCPNLKTLDLLVGKVHLMLNPDDLSTVFAPLKEDIPVYPSLQSAAVLDPVILAYLSFKAEKRRLIAFPGLTRLDICIRQHFLENERIYQIFRHTPHVQRLQANSMCSPYTPREDPFLALDLGRCLQSCKTTLTELQFDLPHVKIFSYGNDGAFVETLYKGLTAIQGDNVLETLILGIQEYTACVVDKWVNETFSAWDELDTILSPQENVGGFPRLRAVRVVIKRVEIAESDGDDPPWLGFWEDEFWPDALPLLHAIDGVSFEYRDEEEEKIFYNLTW